MSRPQNAKKVLVLIGQSFISNVICLHENTMKFHNHQLTNERVALLSHGNDLELSVPRNNRISREIIKIEVHKPENKAVSKNLDT